MSREPELFQGLYRGIYGILKFKPSSKDTKHHNSKDLIVFGCYVLATLAFLNLAMTGVVYCKAWDPRFHHRGVRVPDGLKGPVGLLTPIPEALYSNINRLGLFDIVSASRFGAAES